MRRHVLLLLAMLCTTPLAAQDLTRPDGWMTRFDDPSASESDLEVFVEMPPGWHVTSGPAAIYWSGASIEGDFRAEMEVHLFEPGQRREAFGIIVGGQDLSGPGQNYSYFLIRNGGEFILKRREGTEAPTVQGWTGHDAVVGWADRQADAATVTNVLAIEARGNQVRFFVNDAEVATSSRAEMPVDGLFGFRVNHGLNLHISRLEVTPIG